VVAVPRDHAQARGHELDRVEHAGGDLAAGEGLERHLAQPAQVGFDAIDPRGRQRLLHGRDGGLARGAMDNQLGEHGIVPGADLAAGHDPGFGADIGGKVTAVSVPEVGR
jgi:hypothetical protein